MTNDPNITDSLLDDDDSAAGIGFVQHDVSLMQRLRARQAAALHWFNAAWAKPLWRCAIMAVGSVCALALGLGLYFAVRPVPKPDYETADLGIAFNYTLLTEEFNRLPVEERIELVSQLYNRVRGMDASESAVMAAFFAGIAGEARDQIERNIGKLLIDATDMVAKDYTSVPPEKRGEYLDDAFVRLVRLTAPFDSSIDGKTDEEILERGRRDAKRDMQAMEEGEVTAREASRLLVFLNKQSDKSASVAQQQRLTLFMRDLSRRLRESDR